MMATLSSFQVIVRYPAVSIRFVFTVTLVASEDIPDFNVSLELAVYFVTATINGHASFHFHSENPTNGPILRGTLRLAIFARQADGQPRSRFFFNFPNLGDLQLGVSLRGLFSGIPKNDLSSKLTCKLLASS